ncbi:thioesterase family protein [Desulfococcaceae bacterium HSG7]|nr:thioesterase family protein [Desulfococcaceae bacterium HSG7]
MNKTNIPNQCFETRIAVRFADTDANGHVFFANYLTYFDTAFLDYLKAVDYEFKRFTDQGINFYYAEALSRYKAGAEFGETLRVLVKISKFGNTSFTIEFTTIGLESDTLINTGHIVAVIVDFQSGQPVPIPPDFIAAVKRYEDKE